MKNYVETVLDLGSWILAGAFFGLTALGGLYYYEATQNPDTPRQSFELIQETQYEQDDSTRSFRPPEEFFLVQEYSQTTEDTTPDAAATSKPNGDEARKEPTSRPDEIVESELPYRLVGTVTGSQQFQQAVVRSIRERETRTLTVGDTWENLRIREIHDNRVLIVNQTNNRVEKLSLNPDERNTP